MESFPPYNFLKVVLKFGRSRSMVDSVTESIRLVSLRREVFLLKGVFLCLDLFFTCLSSYIKLKSFLLFLCVPYYTSYNLFRLVFCYSLCNFLFLYRKDSSTINSTLKFPPLLSWFISVLFSGIYLFTFQGPRSYLNSFSYLSPVSRTLPSL